MFVGEEVGVEVHLRQNRGIGIGGEEAIREFVDMGFGRAEQDAFRTPPRVDIGGQTGQGIRFRLPIDMAIADDGDGENDDE